jgi:hypothetical protein
MILVTYTIATNTMTVVEEPFQYENMVTRLVLDFSDTDYENWTKYVTIQMGETSTGVVSDPLGTSASVIYDLVDDLLVNGYIKIQPFAISGGAIKRFPIQSVRVRPSLSIVPYTPSMTDDAFLIVQNKVFTLESEMDVVQGEVADIPNKMNLDGSNSAIDKLVFDTTPASVDALLEGQLRWNATDRTLDIGVDGDGVVLQAGQEPHYPRTVNTGPEDIEDGDLTMYNGTTGGSGVINIRKYDPAPVTLPGQILGPATERIVVNAQGKTSWFGLINGVPTSGSAVGETWVDGQVLYNHPTLKGKLSKNKPTAPIPAVQVAIVVRAHASNGILFVRPIIFPMLWMLSDVYITNPQNGDVLAYDGTNKRWYNKAA